MSDSTSGFGSGGHQDGPGSSRPVEATGGRRAAGAARPPAVTPGGPSGSDDESETSGRRRPPLWVLIVAGVVVVGLVVLAVVLLGNRGGDEPAPVAETVTLEAPTPTVEPIAREAGTAFYDALPSTVLAYALTETAEHPPLIAAGAVEAYRMAYSDGGDTDLVVLAAQWRDAGAAQGALDQVIAAQAVPAVEGEATEGEATEGEATEGEAAETSAEGEDADGEETATEDGDLEVEQGVVEVDGAEAGRYLIVPRADGTGTAWWTNGTVLIQVDGPVQAVRDLYAGFPL